MTIKTGKGGPKPETTTEPAAPPIAVDPLLEKPIPHAYALVPHPKIEGMYFAVHLINVQAERLEHVEPSGRPSHGPFQLNRIRQHMENRHRARKWGSA